MSKVDSVAAGVSMTGRIILGLVWLVGGIACFAAGVWYIGLLAIAYVLYLWVLRGRLLIY